MSCPGGISRTKRQVVPQGPYAMRPQPRRSPHGSLSPLNQPRRSSSRARGGKKPRSGSAKGGSSGSGSGGTSDSGGSSATGSGGGSGPSGTEVTFVKGKAQGAMTGYGYVALGADDSITSPTCGPQDTEITEASPCKSSPNWSQDDAICVSGKIPALDETDPDYDANWGVQVGANATDPDGDGLGQAFKTVTFTLSGKPTSGLRALVHKGSTDYCYEGVTSGKAIDFTDFTKTCYDSASPGTAITAADVASISKLVIQVSSTTSATTVADLCITKIEFGK